MSENIDLSQNLLNRFVIRNDTFLIQQPDGSYVRIEEELTNTVLKDHVNGSLTVATYQLQPNNNLIKWICFDIDPGRIVDSKEKAKKICVEAKRVFGQKSVLPEASRYPDESYHIWCFFEDVIPAFTGKYFGNRILESCNLENEDIELFPKQTELRKCGYGNAVKLPLGLHRKHKKKSTFLDINTFEPIEPEILKKLSGSNVGEALIKTFNLLSSGNLKDRAIVLGDYLLNYLNFKGDKVWTSLKKLKSDKRGTLNPPELKKIMKEISYTPIHETADKKTEFNRQTIVLNEGTKLSEIPCINFVLTHAIPPSRRHDILGKNFSILFYKLNGDFDGFDQFTNKITKKQIDFDQTQFDWTEWVQKKPRSFNCIEVKRFLRNINCEFNCTNCPLQIDTFELSPAGGITEFFVYEPISSQEYVYCTPDGKKGISKIEIVEKACLLNIEGMTFHLKRNPPNSWFFKTPNRNVLRTWISGEKKSKELTALWKEIIDWEKTFLDLPNENDYLVLALFVIQSWISEILQTVFYCSIQGQWGGGKTVCGETTIQMCRHGYSSGSISKAFIQRAIEEQKLSIFFDEIDSTTNDKDSHVYQILRQGYRRGTPYSVVNPKDLKVETYDVFGPKIFSLHSSLESALQSRTILIHTQETKDHKVPVIHPFRKELISQIRDELFLWYLDNACKIKTKNNLVDKVDTVAALGNRCSLFDLLDIKSPAIRREILFEASTRGFSENQLSQLGQLNGRNQELAHILMRISNLVKVNLDNELMEIFKQKTIEEEESLETGDLGTLKEVLVQLHTKKIGDTEYLTEEGFVKISNKEIFEHYVDSCKKNGQDPVSDKQFSGLLAEFGFQRPRTKRKMKVPYRGDEPQSKLCCIFSTTVLNKLGLADDETLPTFELPNFGKIKSATGDLE